MSPAGLPWVSAGTMRASRGCPSARSKSAKLPVRRQAVIDVLRMDRMTSTPRCNGTGPSATSAGLLRGRARRGTTVNFAGSASPGDLVDVRIESSTSTTLRGRAVALAAA